VKPELHFVLSFTQQVASSQVPVLQTVVVVFFPAGQLVKSAHFPFGEQQFAWLFVCPKFAPFRNVSELLQLNPGPHLSPSVMQHSLSVHSKAAQYVVGVGDFALLYACLQV